MSVKAKKYDDDVKYAAACAVLDRKLSYREVVEALAAGELDPDLPRVEMNPNSLSKYVQQEKQRRLRQQLHPSAETSPHELAPDITKRLLSPVLRRLEEFEDAEGRGKLSLEESVNTARMIASAFNAISKTTPRPPKPKPSKDAGVRKPGSANTLSLIAAAGRKDREQTRAGTHHSAETESEGVGVASEADEDSAVEAEGRVPSANASMTSHPLAHEEPLDQGPAVAHTVAQ